MQDGTASASLLIAPGGSPSLLLKDKAGASRQVAP